MPERIENTGRTENLGPVVRELVKRVKSLQSNEREILDRLAALESAVADKPEKETSDDDGDDWGL